MPALTLAQAQSLLDSYVEPDGDFTASLNQVLARIYSMGTYRDLTVQYSLPVVDGCITLPDEADAVLHVTIDGRPMPVRALWHDFKSSGNNQASINMAWGLIDGGYHPIYRFIETATDTIAIVPSMSGTNTDPFDEEEDATVKIVATDGDQLYTSTYADNEFTFDAPVNSIISISFSGLAGKYDLRLDVGDAETAIATVGTGTGVCRYRRLRVAVPDNSDAVVHVLCKRAFQMVSGDYDILYVSNIGALKHGLLGRIAEDNADLERADYHWKQCMLLLEEEASSSRGAAIPRLNIDPFGIGGTSRLYNPM